MRRTGLRMTPGRGSKNWDMGTETAARARPRRESLCYSVVAPTGDPGSYQSNDGPPGPSACPRQRYGRKAMIDSSRRTILTTGAAAAATAAAPQVFAQAPPTSAAQGAPAGAKTGYYEKGNVRIRYAEIGTGFPLLATPGGGLKSRIAVWANAVINIPEEFKNDLRLREVARHAVRLVVGQHQHR